MSSIITTPPSWQELHDVGIQLRKDYDDLHKAYLKQVEAVESARALLVEFENKDTGQWGVLGRMVTAWLSSNPKETK